MTKSFSGTNPPVPSPGEEAEEERHACRVFKFLVLNMQRSRGTWGELTADPLLESIDVACWALLCPLSGASVGLMEQVGRRLEEYLNKIEVEKEREGVTLTKKERFLVESCSTLICVQASKWREENKGKL